MHYFIFVLAALNICTTYGQTCPRTNCKKTVKNFVVQQLSVVRKTDVKFKSWSDTKKVQITKGDQRSSERACVKECQNSGVSVCKSAHLSPYASQQMCYLFNNSLYEEVDKTSKVLASTGWTSFHLLNSFCESKPCQNSSPCIPDYVKDIGKCKCLGYSGRYCGKLDPMNQDGVGHWVFDTNELRNIGSGAATLGHGSVINGTIMEVPARKGKVIQCNGNGDYNHRCFVAPAVGTTCLTDFAPNYCQPDGFTFGFWFRATQFDTQSTAYGYLINQGYGYSGGMNFAYGRSMGIWLELNSVDEECMFNEFAHLYKTQWNFIALTGDGNGNYYCFFNNLAFKKSYGTSTSQSASNPYNFGGPFPFFISDVIFIPKYSDRESLEVIYNQTRRL